MSAPTWGAPRDRDGTRLKAKQLAPGKKASDSLKVPDDTSDWRYIQVKEDGRLTVRVDYQPTSSPLSVRLLDSRGKVIKALKGTKGRASFTEALTPGIYYLEVELASGQASYTVSYALK
ncbi:MAG: hypothetical protein CMH57_05360 [Myxococcales bacterium]|nr:hypothetical protein [Myxococcales bacterium]